MKKILLSVLSLTGVLSLQAQQISDMVSTEAGNTHDVFYSLANGEVSSVVNSDWDLAFNTSIFGADLRINDGKGVVLYAYPSGDTSDFMTLDTAGIATWTQLYNSTEIWDKGAFNANTTSNAFDYGWGVYNPATHNVTGDSIFVIKTLAGNYKKIWIQSKNATTSKYNYKYSNLDNTGMVSESVTFSNYSTKNFFYYSIDNATVIDREPATANWDFVATKYKSFVSPPGAYYDVTGILTNRGVKTREARNTVVTTAVWSNFPEEEPINVIGYDWKNPNQQTGAYTMVSDLSYFITDKVGNIWQIIFTGFGGSTTGDIDFTKEMISAVSIEENASINLGVYPNPASEQVTFLYDNLIEDIATITIQDLQGKVVYSNQFSGQGFNQQTIDVSNLNSGIYNVIIASETRTGVQKLVIQ